MYSDKPFYEFPHETIEPIETTNRENTTKAITEYNYQLVHDTSFAAENIDMYIVTVRSISTMSYAYEKKIDIEEYKQNYVFIVYDKDKDINIPYKTLFGKYAAIEYQNATDDATDIARFFYECEEFPILDFGGPCLFTKDHQALEDQSSLHNTQPDKLQYRSQNRDEHGQLFQRKFIDGCFMGEFITSNRENIFQDEKLRMRAAATPNLNLRKRTNVDSFFFVPQQLINQ